MEKEFKGYKGSGKILVMIPVKDGYKKIPNYFYIKLDLSKIKERRKTPKK